MIREYDLRYIRAINFLAFDEHDVQANVVARLLKRAAKWLKANPTVDVLGMSVHHDVEADAHQLTLHVEDCNE